MTPLPGALAPGAPLVAWRLDAAFHARAWDSGIGAERAGGRWSPKGLKVVCASFDPSTAILESAVHRGFAVLDAQPFVLTSLIIGDPADVQIVRPVDVPNLAWLQGGIPSAGQQAGAPRCSRFALSSSFPSVVSKFAWNVLFRPDKAVGRYAAFEQDRPVLDSQSERRRTTRSR